MASSPIFGDLDDANERPTGHAPGTAFSSFSVAAPQNRRPTEQIRREAAKYLRIEPPAKVAPGQVSIKVMPAKVVDRSAEIELKPKNLSIDLLEQAANLVQLDKQQVNDLRKRLDTRTKEVSEYILNDVVIELLAAKKGLEEAVIIVRDGLGQDISQVNTDYMAVLSSAKALQLVNFLLQGHDGIWKKQYLETVCKLYAERAAGVAKTVTPLAPEEVTRAVGTVRTVSGARKLSGADRRPKDTSHEQT